MRTVNFFLIPLILAAGAVPHSSSGPMPLQAIGDQGLAALALPGVGQTMPPAWVRTGLRLSYHVETATIAGTGKDWRPDENGLWETPDHQRWSPGEKRPGAAEGFMQFDVTATGPSETGILATFYLVGRPGATPSMGFQYPVVGLPGNAGGLWVNPAELRKMRVRNTPSFKVLRMPYRIGGQLRPSVWIQGSTGSRYQVFVYDEATGVLLHDASSTSGRASNVIGKDEVSNTPSTILADGTLVSQRQLSLPWLGEDATGWAARAVPMAYSGSSTVPTSGGRPLVLRQDLRVQPKASGHGWVVYDMLLTTTNTMGMPPISNPGQTISGLGQFGSAWLPPSSLARLVKGQVLDRDPVTGVTVTVGDARPGQVILVGSSAAQTTTWGYDLRSGLLNLIARQDHNPFAPISSRLTLVGG